MKTKNLLHLFFFALLFACEQPKALPDGLADTYYGVLPCADCPGIYYELQLNEDFTYSETRFYQESDGDTIRTSGKFEIQQDSIVALKADSAENAGWKFKFSQGELKLLNQNGKEIESELADHFLLKTTKPKKAEVKAEPSKIFKATGTEPFWLLKIDSEKDSIHFEPMDGTPIKEAISLSTDMGEEWRYETSSENELLKVSVVKTTCQNDMSGELFPYQVSVTFKTTEMQESKTYTGCGEFLNAEKTTAAAEKIDGKWTLKKINENLVEAGDYKIPTMEIRLSEGRVSGNAGCNQYSGKIKTFDENKLAISMVISTKMACPGLETEVKFLGAISGKVIEFEKSGNQLVLSNEATKLVFEKAE